MPAFFFLPGFRCQSCFCCDPRQKPFLAPLLLTLEALWPPKRCEIFPSAAREKKLLVLRVKRPHAPLGAIRTDGDDDDDDDADADADADADDE